MAKINVMGNAVLFESSMKLEDLERVKKYRPEALCVKDDDGEIKFVVVTAHGSMGDVDSDCVVFGKASVEGKAIVTKIMPDMPETAEELKNILADKMGAALNYMTLLESTLPGVLGEVNAERETVMNAITVG